MGMMPPAGFGMDKATASQQAAAAASMNAANSSEKSENRENRKTRKKLLTSDENENLLNVCFIFLF
jgi:hypothetical protein